MRQHHELIQILQERSRRILAGEAVDRLELRGHEFGSDSEVTVIRDLQINHVTLEGCRLINIQFESCTFRGVHLGGCRVVTSVPLMRHCNGIFISAQALTSERNDAFLFESCFIVWLTMWHRADASQIMVSSNSVMSVLAAPTIPISPSYSSLWERSSAAIFERTVIGDLVFTSGESGSGHLIGTTTGPSITQVTRISAPSHQARWDFSATAVPFIACNLWSTVFQAGGWNPALTISGDPKKLDIKKFLRHGSDHLDGVLPEDIPAREDFIEAILSVFSQQLTIYESYCLGESR